MEIKIVSDGTWMGTKVIDAKTGELLKGVTDVRWEFDANTFPEGCRLWLRLIDVPVELQGKAHVTVHTWEPSQPEEATE